MTLLKHLRAHWRNPLYAFCEWYMFGRQSNWDEVPTPVAVSNDLSDVKIKRMWMRYEGIPVDLEPAPGPAGRRSRMTRQFSCVHMAASGLGLHSVRCGVCGPMRRIVA